MLSAEGRTKNYIQNIVIINTIWARNSFHENIESFTVAMNAFDILFLHEHQKSMTPIS